MYLYGTHQPLTARLRLSLRRDLGAGNFFWHACRVTRDHDRDVLFRPTESGLRGYSMARLQDRATGYARWHHDHGVVAGSRVGVQTSDGLAGLLHHIAITSLGATTVLTNPDLAPEPAAGYLDRSGARLVVGDRSLLESCAAARRDHIPEPVTADLDTIDREVDVASGAEPPRYRHRDDDMVLISHSSGTTGVPKPTAFAHRSFFVGKRERLWNFASSVDDRLLTALPQSHSSGISYVSLAIMLGLPTLMLDDRSGTSLAAGMNAFHPTVVIGFPISLAELPVNDLEPAAASTVHTWMGMGDASHERHIRPLVALGSGPARGPRRGGSTYVDGLGSSEMGMVLFRYTHGPDSDRYGRVIGRPARVVRDAAVLDESGRPLPDGQAGLLGVHTPSSTPGYVGEPEMTDDARRGDYFLTGDVVRKDPDGTWYHLDRTPDVIRTVQGPVYSLPVEEVVLLCTDGLDAAVVAVDDPASPDRQRPVAVVLPHDGATLDAERALRECNEELTRRDLHGLAAVVVARGRDDLPVGVTGKVLKRVLRERLRRVLDDPAAAGSAPSARAIAEATG